jgi:hypothetical protein
MFLCFDAAYRSKATRQSQRILMVLEIRDDVTKLPCRRERNSHQSSLNGDFKRRSITSFVSQQSTHPHERSFIRTDIKIKRIAAFFKARIEGQKFIRMCEKAWQRATKKGASERLA